MKVSELIMLLQKYRTANGDLDVEVWHWSDMGQAYTGKMLEVVYVQDKFSQRIRIESEDQ